MFASVCVLCILMHKSVSLYICVCRIEYAKSFASQPGDILLYIVDVAPGKVLILRALMLTVACPLELLVESESVTTNT